MGHNFITATPGHRDLLLPLLADFYQGESLPLTPAVLAAMDVLLQSPDLGVILLLPDHARALAYFVVTFGYSLERGGRVALLDELYVSPEARGCGVGKASIKEAIAVATRAGCHTLHLEVDHANLAAQELYQRAGFRPLPRHYLTIPLPSPAP